MPIEIEQESGAAMGTADKDYFLDDNGEVTTDTEKAAVLLIRAGQEIPKQMADKYGIGKVAQNADDEAAEAESSAPVEEKAAKPSQNKAQKPARNK